MKLVIALLWILILLAVFYRNEVIAMLFNRQQENFCPCR